MGWLILAYAFQIFGLFLIGYCPYRAMTHRRFQRVPVEARGILGILLGYFLALFMVPFLPPFFELGLMEIHEREDGQITEEMMGPDEVNLNYGFLCTGWIPALIGLFAGANVDGRRRRKPKADSEQSTSAPSQEESDLDENG